MRSTPRLQVDILADEPPQQVFHVGDQLIEAHDLGCDHLSSCIGQELSCQSGGTRSRAFDLEEIGA